MENLNNAIKSIENKGKKSVDPKKNKIAEVAPAVAAVGKGLAVAGKAALKGTAAVAKGGAKAAKGAAKATKPAKKPVRFKRPNVRNPKYKDPKTGEFNRDLYDKDRALHKKIKKDQASRPDMSQTKPDGPSDTRTKRGERKLKAIDKLTTKKKEAAKKAMQKTGDVTKKAAEKGGEYAKKSISATSGAFGSNTFTKEGTTFRDYLNKL